VAVVGQVWGVNRTGRWFTPWKKVLTVRLGGPHTSMSGEELVEDHCQLLAG